MNPLLARLGQAAVRRGTLEAVSTEFLESFPLLSALMSGSDASEGRAGTPALTLRLFWEAERMKACLGRHNYPQCVFLCVPDPIKALDSIETELRADRVEVKRAKV